MIIFQGFDFLQINQDNELKPVLLYIHGGSFVGGSGLSGGNGPDYLMDHDIVLITINYRLGLLGFFSTGDEYAPGNYGMKDVVEALRWVQNNIKSFGGDPNRVTIAGESAGGAAVAFQVVSPMARGEVLWKLIFSYATTIGIFHQVCSTELLSLVKAQNPGTPIPIQRSFPENKHLC